MDGYMYRFWLSKKTLFCLLKWMMVGSKSPRCHFSIEHFQSDGTFVIFQELCSEWLFKQMLSKSDVKSWFDTKVAGLSLWAQSKKGGVWHCLHRPLPWCQSGFRKCVSKAMMGTKAVVVWWFGPCFRSPPERPSGRSFLVVAQEPCVIWSLWFLSTHFLFHALFE